MNSNIFKIQKLYCVYYRLTKSSDNAIITYGDKNDFYRRIYKNKRTELGLSQKRLGTMVDLSDSEIMKIENGTRKTPN